MARSTGMVPTQGAAELIRPAAANWFGKVSWSGGTNERDEASPARKVVPDDAGHVAEVVGAAATVGHDHEGSGADQVGEPEQRLVKLFGCGRPKWGQVRDEAAVQVDAGDYPVVVRHRLGRRGAAQRVPEHADPCQVHSRVGRRAGSTVPRPGCDRPRARRADRG